MNRTNADEVKAAKPKADPSTPNLMKREDFDWGDPYCPHCGSEKIFMLIVKLHPVRELTSAEIIKVMAAGVVIEDGNYYLQKTICCLDCEAATKFTEPVECPWAPRLS